MFHTDFEGQDCVGNMNFIGHGRSWPINAHSHICNPLLEQMSASVVAPRYNWHHCACINSFFIMFSKVDKCSMINKSPCHWGYIQLSDSNHR